MQDEVKVTQADREAAYGAYFECYDTAPNDLWLQAMLEGRHDEDSLIQVLAHHRHQAEREEEEAHKIGISEGRQEMVREIDLATGGDGEFRWSTEPDRHCPCEEAMKARVIERFHQAERETLAQVPAAIAEARRQALEEAAKVAGELEVSGKPSTMEWANCMAHARDIAQAIRALASDPLLDRHSPSPPPVV